MTIKEGRLDNFFRCVVYLLDGGGAAHMWIMRSFPLSSRWQIFSMSRSPIWMAFSRD